MKSLLIYKKHILNIALVILLVISLVNSYFIFRLSEDINGNLVGTEKAAELVPITSTVITEANCKECPDLNVVVKNLEQAGVVISKKKELAYDDAKKILVKYNITKLPALILSKEFSSYELSSNWNLLGHIAEDGSYILDLQQPPYYDFNTKETIGLVSVTTISDLSCTSCYNATLVHLPIIERFGVFIKNEKSLDASSAEAVELIKKYSIKSLPTVLISKEAADYTSLVKAWKDVGTLESDNVMVFRKNEILGLGYKDLTTGKIIEPAPNA